MMDGGHIAQEDLALYAMHGMPEEESTAVRAHVQRCAACKAELEQLTSDLAMVAMSVEQQTLPDGARQRFLEKMEATPAGKAQSAKATVVPIRKELKTRGTMTWIPWAMAAVLALIAVSLGMRVSSQDRELKNQTRELAELMMANIHSQEVMEVLTASAAQHVVLTASKATPAPSARVAYLASRGGLILQASNLGPLPEGKTYELWVIPANGKAPIPAGLFRPDATGSASVVMPRIPEGVAAKAFGVTIERAEGSETPTLPIVLAGAAAAS